MQAARLTLGEHAMRLEDAVGASLDLELAKDLQTSDWSAPSLTQAQLEYAAVDAVMVWRIAERIFPTLGPQTPAYEIQIAATPAAVRMKNRGFRLDLEAHADLIRAK
jgi:ribonuclease D